MNDFKVKKVKKKNCSNVRIYSKSSELVRKENERRKNIVLKKCNKDLKRNRTKLEIRNEIYRINSSSVERLRFNNTITQDHYVILKQLISSQHRKKRLKKTSFQSFLKNLRKNRTDLINKVLEN